jgi:hypothetical protein
LYVSSGGPCRQPTQCSEKPVGDSTAMVGINGRQW